MEHQKKYRRYKVLYKILIPVIRFLYPVQAVHTERIPHGAAILCGNHSCWVDPFFIAYTLQGEPVHMMAKTELFKNKLVGSLLKALLAFPVDREKTDLTAVKTAMKYLGRGVKIGIFPEGTRSKESKGVSPKVGAVKIAAKMNVPVVPVYIPRKKHVFQPLAVVVGEPYYINPEKTRLSNEAYVEKAQELMQKIDDLKREAAWK